MSQDIGVRTVEAYSLTADSYMEAASRLPRDLYVAHSQHANMTNSWSTTNATSTSAKAYVFQYKVFWSPVVMVEVEVPLLPEKLISWPGSPRWASNLNLSSMRISWKTTSSVWLPPPALRLRRRLSKKITWSVLNTAKTQDLKQGATYYYICSSLSLFYLAD